MGFLEIKLYEVIEKKYGLEERIKFEEIWDHSLDDCFSLFDSKIQPEELLTILNSLNENIQFTMELSDIMIPFLDVSVTIHGKIIPCIYIYIK